MLGGFRTISAVYSSDTNFTGSTSVDFTQTVQQTTTTTVTSSDNPSVYREVLIYTVTVNGLSGSGVTPAGTVTFSDGSTSLGTASLSGTGTTATASFPTTTPITVLSTHTITVQYTGDLISHDSEGHLNQTVNKASTTTSLAAVNATVYSHDQVTFTATVTGNLPSTGGTPTGGTVTFQDGGSSIGTAPLTSGTATLTLASTVLPVGSNVITAIYSGDSDYNPSGTSAPKTQTVDQAVLTWTGNTSVNWGDSGNWKGLSSNETTETPATGDELVFAGSANTTSYDNISGLSYVKSITFDAGANNFLLSGYGSVTGITVTGNGTYAGTGNALVGNNTSGNNTISLNVTFSTTAPTISQAGTGSLVLSGNVSGTSGLTKNGGSGTLVLGNATNSYTGGTNLNAGTISVSDDHDLGNTTGNLTFAGGTLAVTGNITTSRNMTLSTSGTFNVSNATTLTASGVISGGGSLAAIGAGTLTLAGTNSGLSGNVTVSTEL